MIADTISFLRRQLNSYFVGFRGLPSDLPVVMRALVDAKGDSTPGGDQGVSLTLVNLEQEAATRRPYVQRETPNGVEVGPAELHLNLSILVTADFRSSNGPSDPEAISQNYAQALQSLTRVLSFFHAHPCFQPSDSPDLPEGIEKLVVRQVNLSIQEQQNLWAYLGAKYLPSVLYKVSLVTLRTGEVTRTAVPIVEVDLNLASR